MFILSCCYCRIFIANYSCKPVTCITKREEENYGRKAKAIREKTKHFVCKHLDDSSCVFAVQGLQAFLQYVYDLAGS
jgi:hypothetical protein